MDNRPIGVFDSGLGGLTTVAELKRCMPYENIVYFGDTGRVPYGTKSKDTVRKYALQDIRFLLSKDVKMVICACNTASTVITPDILPDKNIPFAQVLTPAVLKAADTTKNKKIGVIGTTATINSKAYTKALLEIDPEFEITDVPCPLFVPLVENRYTNRDNPVTKMVANEYLAPILEAGVDTLILGCTHYPIIKDIISDITGDKVTLIDSGREVSSVAYDTLFKHGLLNDSDKEGVRSFYSSDSAEDFYKNASYILDDINLRSTVKIDIESF